MPTRLTITIDQNTTGGKDGETRRAELVQAAEAVERCVQQMVTSSATSGSVSDRNGALTGHWTYVPSSAV
jgi:hypothetical protein